MCMKQGTRNVIFAQASLSRLGESSRSLPRSFSRVLAQARELTFSERPSRSSKMVSPKRVFAKPLRASIAISSKRELAA